ncbi:unnamed protein product, partial [Pylaiella littoralis]
MYSSTPDRRGAATEPHSASGHPQGRGAAEDDSSSVDEMDTDSGGGGGGGGEGVEGGEGGGVCETKWWSPAEEEGDHDQEFFENGEYLPSRIDTTQHSYHAVCDRDKLGVRYRGQPHHESDWGTVRANHPLPRRCRVWYFEATVAAQGERCSITVGLVPESFPMNKQPGAESSSYGVEGSNGEVISGGSRGSSVGSSLSTGDTVGLGVNFKKREAFLTHNGKLLGAAFPDIRCALGAAGLYPCVGLHSPGEAVRINFGQRPFLFDLSASVAGEDYREQAAVAAVRVCPSLLRSLVRDYLLHQGCEETLKSLDEADGEGAAWTKDAAATAAAAAGKKSGKASTAAAAAGAATGTTPPPPSSFAAQNGLFAAHNGSSSLFSNGAGGSSSSGSGSNNRTAPSRSGPAQNQQEQGGGGSGNTGQGTAGDGGTSWVSTVSWGVSMEEGDGGRQGRRGSEAMDLEETSLAETGRVGTAPAGGGEAGQQERGLLLLGAGQEEAESRGSVGRGSGSGG